MDREAVLPLVRDPAIPRYALKSPALGVSVSNPGSSSIARFPVAVFDNYWGSTLAVTLSLGRHGVPLHFYGRGAARWSRYRSRRFSCPPAVDTDAFLPWLRERIRSGEIQRVAPTTDLVAYYLSLLRDEFAPEVQRTIAPLEEIENCLIKTRFSSICTSMGQPVPVTASPDDPESAVAAAERIGFPLVIKPKSHLLVGPLVRGHLVSSVQELRNQYRPYPVARGQEVLARRYPELCWPLLQEYVPTARYRVFSVSGFRDADAGFIATSLSYKRAQWPPDTGTSTSQISSTDQRILRTGLNTVSNLLSRGIFEVELLVSGAKLLAIDLNPRAFGFLSLDMALGNDLPWLWFQSTLGAAALQPVTRLPQVIESRLGIPYHLNRCAQLLLGAREPGEEGNGGEPAPKVDRIVPMVGGWSDPVPHVLANLSLLRHPRALLRPYLRLARRQGRVIGDGRER
jgi:hypothetical protein